MHETSSRKTLIEVSPSDVKLEDCRDAISMEFGLNKRARVILITRKFFKFSNVALDVNITIRKLE